MPKGLTFRNALLHLEASKYPEQEKYWQNELPEPFYKSYIPGDVNTSNQKRTAASRLNTNIYIPPEVKEITCDNGDKLFIVLASSISLLIKKFSKGSQVSFGVSNPYWNKSEEFSSELLILKAEINENTTIRDLLNTVRSKWINAVRNSRFPLEFFDDNENEDQSSLHDIVLLFNNKNGYSNSGSIKANLIFNFFENDGKLSVDLIYNAKVYSLTKAERLIKYLNYWISILFKDLDALISGIETIHPEEKDKLFKSFNDTRTVANRDKLFLNYFEEKRETLSEKIAAKDKNFEISYKSLDLEANRIANLLIKSGLERGDSVVVIYQRSVPFLVAILGIMKSGGVFVALDVDEPLIRAVSIIKQSGATSIITSGSNLLKEDFLEGVARETKIAYLISLDKLSNPKNLLTKFRVYRNTENHIQSLPSQVVDYTFIQDQKTDRPDIVLCPTDLCYIVFSSGTTGKPKGIKLHHLGMINHFLGLIERLEVTEQDIFAQSALCSFDVYVVQTLLTLTVGGKTLFMEKDVLLDPKAFLEIIQSERVTCVELVPSLIKTLLENIDPTDYPLSSLRYLLSSGEQLTFEVVSHWFKSFNHVPLVNAYGPAEASDDVTIHIIQDIEESATLIPIGTPLHNTEIYVVDDFNQLSPLGVDGEICISGYGVGQGYLDNEAETNSVFVNNPFAGYSGSSEEGYEIMYKTGDIGFWGADGYLICKGRIDHMLKIRGVRIEPAEIEIQLSVHPQIEEAIISDFDNGKEKVLCAYYVESGPVRADDLEKFLKNRLPSAMIPSFYTRIEKIPYTKNGKVDRKNLPSPIKFNDRLLIDLKDPIQIKLLDIWKEILNVDGNNIGKDSDFFQMGGHSLALIRLMSLINKEFNTKVALDKLFATSRFSSMVALIQSLEKYINKPIPKTLDKPYYRTSPSQRRFYLHNHIYPSDLSYNISQFYEVIGAFLPTKFEYAVKQVVEKHEVLRTSFKIIDNVPVQFIRETELFELKHFKSDKSEIQDLIKSFVKPFDLEVGPLLRINIHKCSEDKFFIFIDMHHIISDDISDKIIIDDLLKAYNGQVLSRSKITYKDYSEWFNDLLDVGEFAEHEKYWLKVFSSLPPILNLPFDSFDKYDTEKYGQDLMIELNEEMSSAIRELMKKYEVTPYMFFLAVFNVQLRMLTFSEDIAVGTPVSGREHEDINEIVGLFLNQIVVRNQPKGSFTFEKFLSEVKTNCLNALKYQAYPFDLLTSKLGLQGKVNEAPLYNVMFASLNKESQNIVFDEFVVSKYHVPHNTAKTDLQITLFEGTSNFEVLLTADARLFKNETCNLLLESFKKILEITVDDPGISLSNIPLPVEFKFLNKGTINVNRYELTF